MSNDNQSKSILVTSALPYANGSLHLGHMLETIQTDIWVRARKLAGRTCYYVCGDDAHGTAVMLSAERKGISAEHYIEQIHQEHSRDLNDFLIGLDHFYTTHSAENQALSSLIYQRLKANGDISRREIEQAFDTEKNIFLPDRYIKGQCPECKTPDQYGDNCEHCGANYSPMELIDPVSVISGSKPIAKTSEHLFFELDHYRAMLEEWMSQGHLQEQVSNKLKEWFDVGLQAWDISRDAPYFGFAIPEEQDKYFYVWLDAPVGYMASFKKFCELKQLDFDEFWGPDSQAELYHFIGKDIIYFHALFWPAMLAGSGFRTPSAIITHGFLTINGQKMSKSRGTFVNARDYLNHFNPEYLRYYFAAKLNQHLQDIDLNLDDFKQRVNSDLVGKVVNIASRCAGFIRKGSEGQLAASLAAPELFEKFTQARDAIAEYYENCEFSRAVRTIMNLADLANQYIDEQKPWVLNKEEGKALEVQAICSQGINFYKVLITYLKPILPVTAKASEAFLNCDELNFANVEQPLLNHTINRFKPLIQRITDEQLDNLMNHEK